MKILLKDYQKAIKLINEIEDNKDNNSLILFNLLELDKLHDRIEYNHSVIWNKLQEIKSTLKLK